MKKDQALRDVVRALRKANSRGATTEDLGYAHRLAMAYRSPVKSLDVEEAIRELNNWGSTDQPREVSPELRYTMLLYLKGKIGRKRGAPAQGTSVAKWGAYEVRRRSAENGIPLAEASRQVVDEWKPSLTAAALDAALFPRPRKRKT